MITTNKAWVVQNTTHFTNEQIKYMIDFVNPFISSELNDPSFRVRKAKSTLQNVVIRVIRDSERDAEYKDTNAQGSYIPQIKWRPHGLLLTDKPVVTAIIPNSNNISFPIYSNLGALELFKKKKLEVTRQDMKELRYARYSVGHSVIVYLSWEELLIRILAHELRHHWQRLNRNFRKKINLSSMISQ